MNGLVKTVFGMLAASVAVIGASTATLAADEIEEASVPEIALTPQAVGGWYLRGDLGYNISSRTGFDVTQTGNDRVSQGFDLDKSFAPSIGVGYQFTDYLRADVTASYSRQDLDDFPAEARTWDMMANAYVDIGNLAGFTPYLGAGLGFANIRYAVDTDAGKFKTDDDYRFAWALMAGVGIDLVSNVKLDLGYRYGVINGGDIAGGDGITVSDRDLKSHQLRAGIRVSIW